jgi:hypothetical protein
VGRLTIQVAKGPLNIDELYEWRMGCFVGESLLSMRHPSKDWNGFISDLQGFLKQEKVVWDPIKKNMCPWIDIAKLHPIYGRTGVQRTRPRPETRDPNENNPLLQMQTHTRPQSLLNLLQFIMKKHSQALERIHHAKLILLHVASLHHAPRLRQVPLPSLFKNLFNVRASAYKEGYHHFMNTSTTRIPKNEI